MAKRTIEPLNLASGIFLPTKKPCKMKDGTILRDENYIGIVKGDKITLLFDETWEGGTEVFKLEHISPVQGREMLYVRNGWGYIEP